MSGPSTKGRRGDSGWSCAGFRISLHAIIARPKFSPNIRFPEQKSPLNQFRSWVEASHSSICCYINKPLPSTDSYCSFIASYNGASTAWHHAFAGTPDAPRSNTAVSPSPELGIVTQQLLFLTSMTRFGWFVGHLTLLFCSVRYGFSWISLNYYSTWAQISYRTAFVAAAFTYGIVVYKSVRARMRGRTQVSALSFTGDENVQYLGMLHPTSLLPNGRNVALTSNTPQLWPWFGYSLAKSPLPSSPSWSTPSSMSQPTLART